jgi:hypothetical protein
VTCVLDVVLRVRGRALACAAYGAIALAVASCGPSFQAVYEGDVRFEHCYAVDETVNTTMKEKADCWRDWMKSYTYGQTRDRVEYAAARHYALVVAPNAPTDEAMMEAAPGGGIRHKVITAPMPTSVYAPPPSTMPEPEKGDGGVAAPDGSGPKTLVTPKVRAPGSECGDDCSNAWNVCKESCSGTTCDVCDARFRTCMGACFKDDKKKPHVATPAPKVNPPAAPKP